MGSFPNLTAARILSSLFVNPSIAGTGTPSLYVNNANSTTGIFSGGSTVNLYIGLLMANVANQTGGNALASIITDAAITSAGTSSPTTANGVAPNFLREYTVGSNGMERKAATFGITQTGDGASIVTVSGPSAAISFASNSTAGATHTSHDVATTSVVGFFISTVSVSSNATGSAPNIIAYGRLSSSRSINNGDNPTFAQNAITITLD